MISPKLPLVMKCVSRNKIILLYATRKISLYGLHETIITQQISVIYSSIKLDVTEMDNVKPTKAAAAHNISVFNNKRPNRVNSLQT